MDSDERKEIMVSHERGEVWGLSVGLGKDQIVTTGDDN